MKIFIQLLVIFTIIVNCGLFSFASLDDMRNAYSEKEYTSAIAAADEILKSNDAYMDAYYIKAMSGYHSGDLQTTYDTLITQLSHNPKNQLALYNAACSAALLGLESEAVDLIERLLVLDMTNKSAIKADSDFNSIRDNEKYKKLMEINVIFAGQLLEFDVPPVLISGRTFLPVRRVFEELGAEVSYIEESRTVIGKKDGFKLELIIGEKTAFVNGEATELDAPAIIKDGRTLAPIRFVAESMNAQIDWDSSNQFAYIKTLMPNGDADYDTTKEQMDSMLAVLPIDGAFAEPYLMPATDAMTLMVFKDAEGIKLFNSLSEQNKYKYVSNTVYENYALVVGCRTVLTKIIFDGNTYYEGNFYYEMPDLMALNYYERGKPTNVVKQYKDENGGNYKDFYLLPAEQQITSKIGD